MRTVALSAAVLWLAQQFGLRFVDSLLPCFRWEIAALDPDYRVQMIEIGQDAFDTVVRLRVVVARAIVAGGRVLMPDASGWIEVTTTVGTVLQPLLIALVMSGAWPARRVTEYLARTFLAIPILATVLLIDTPLLLWGMVCDVVIQVTEPQRFSPVVAWSQFLSSGGRLGLGIVAGALVIWAAARVRAQLEAGLGMRHCRRPDFTGRPVSPDR